MVSLIAHESPFVCVPNVLPLYKLANNIETYFLKEKMHQKMFKTMFVGIYGQSDCSSQLPLLDFMRLPDPE